MTPRHAVSRVASGPVAGAGWPRPGRGGPERVSSCVSSGTRIRRTGRFSERSTVKSCSAWPIGVRRSRSECWMRSGVRMFGAYVSGDSRGWRPRGAPRRAGALGGGEPVGDEGVHAAHDVGHGARAPVTEVGVAEVLPVALRPARVAGVDADPPADEALPLPHERPAVEGGRAAVDLDHEGRGLARSRARARKA